MDRNRLTQNLGLKIGSVAVALLLWFHIATEKETYERTLEVPLLVVGVASGQVIAEEIPATQQILFRGKGKRLLTLPWRDIWVEVDATDIRSRGTFTLGVENVHFPEGLRLEVAEVLLPNRVTIVLDNRISMRLPVQPHMDVEAASGYTLVGVASSDPDSVTLTGPESKIRQISFVEVDTFRMRRRLRSPIEREVAVISPSIYNLTIEPVVVYVRWDVQQLGERTFPEIPVQFTGTDNPERYLATPRTASVTVGGGEKLLEGLRAEDISLILDLQGQRPDGLTSIEPRVELPGGISFLSMEPRFFRVTEF